MRMLMDRTKEYRAMKDTARVNNTCTCMTRMIGFLCVEGCPAQNSTNKHARTETRTRIVKTCTCHEMNSLPTTRVPNTCTCHEMNSLPTTRICTDPYTTIQRNRALLNRTLMIENIMADRKQRYIKSVHEHFDSLVGQYYDALQGWEVERCIGVKKEIFKVWTMIRKWNRAG